MEHRALGTQGLVVSALGLGCMGMSQAYGPADEDESVATLQRALELGITLFDTANAYGLGHNEQLVGRVLADHRDQAILATKFGIAGRRDGRMVIDGKPEYAKACCEESLRRLGMETIDLYYLHRVDQSVPIEEMIGAMAELVTAGKVRHLGLSEASATTIRRAHATHPITALQSEWSLFNREPEETVLPTLRELGNGFVPFSPLGRGFLTGEITTRRRLRSRRLSLDQPSLPGRELHSQPLTGGSRHPDGRGQGLHPRPAGADVARRSGRRRRAHPGYQATPLPRRERGRPRRGPLGRRPHQDDEFLPVGGATGPRYEDMSGDALR